MKGRVLWPKIKRKVKDFLSDESGSASKSSIIRMGVISTAIFASAAMVSAEDTGNHPRVTFAENLDCNKDGLLITKEAFNMRNLYVKVYCDEPDTDDNCEVSVGVVNSQGTAVSPGIVTGDAYCSNSFWHNYGFTWIETNGATWCDMSGDTEGIGFNVNFDDILGHENSLSMLSDRIGHWGEFSDKITAVHENNLIPGAASDCSYHVHAFGDDREGSTEVCITLENYYLNNPEHPHECHDVYVDGMVGPVKVGEACTGGIEDYYFDCWDL